MYIYIHIYCGLIGMMDLDALCKLEKGEYFTVFGPYGT